MGIEAFAFPSTLQEKDGQCEILDSALNSRAQVITPTSISSPVYPKAQRSQVPKDKARKCADCHRINNVRDSKGTANI